MRKHLLTILTVCIIIMTSYAHADECKNPELLPPDLKEAYYELKEISREIEGMYVDILCNKRIGTIKREEIKPIKDLSKD